MNDQVSERELLAEEMIARLMDAISAGDRRLTVQLVQEHPICDLPIVVLSLAGYLHRQEKQTEIQTRLANNAENAGLALRRRADTAERKVRDLRGELADVQASLSTLMRRQREVAA